MALEKSWHAACFICIRCRAPLAALPFVVHEGTPLCRSCHEEEQAVPCNICRQPIRAGEEPGHRVGSRYFHRRCFACSVCRAPLYVNDACVAFAGTDDALYCKEHAEAQVRAAAAAVAATMSPK
jgi:hypothetical protein